MDVESYLRAPGQGPEKLHHLLQLSHQSGALISATLWGPHVQEAVDQGLQRGHAYTLTGITKVLLMRFRTSSAPLRMQNFPLQF